jgi:hypothetical protein
MPIAGKLAYWTCVWSECSCVVVGEVSAGLGKVGKRTSTVDTVGMLYVKFPVLKSLLREPMERMSFADSTFSLMSGWLMDPT